MRFNRRRSRHAPLGLRCAFTFILGELESRRPPGRCIGFETTETAAIANAANALRLINEVQGAGCRFSLDDSCCGLSVFTYLKHLPADVLKIDRSFATGMAPTPSTAPWAPRSTRSAPDGSAHHRRARRKQSHSLRCTRSAWTMRRGMGLGHPIRWTQVLPQPPLQDEGLIC